MEITNYYKFRNKYRSSTVQVHVANIDTKGSDYKLRLLTGSYGEIIFPLIFKHDSGSKFHDVLNTGWSSLYLVSDKMIITLKNNKLTGWKTFPVLVYDKKGNEIAGYHGLSITGRCGRIDYSKSEIIYKKYVEQGPFTKQYKGIFLGLDTWDGSDFFLSKGTFGIYVTKKAKEVMTKAKLTNMSFENLSEIETSDHVVSTYDKNVEKNLSYF